MFLSGISDHSKDNAMRTELMRKQMELEEKRLEEEIFRKDMAQLQILIAKIDDPTLEQRTFAAYRVQAIKKKNGIDERGLFC
mmetsp:Transcript_13495/g.37291  ORF Transcript_13495/g.37291 Transcript_13495/m.37291 type:complete len:82 (+) Transcript_13495:1575-1820(+)